MTVHSLHKFYELSPYRVREVLFVSSEYDAFVLETEGQMAERLFFKYSEFYMVGAPRISHATNVEEALEILALHRVDLVVFVVRQGELVTPALGAKLRRLYPSLPLVLLLLDVAHWRRSQIQLLSSYWSGIFLWTGELNLIVAMFNYVEDRLNVDSDTTRTGVQVIISVEDTVADYSVFLPQLYAELMEQSRLLSGEGVNFAQRMLRMLARPKILLASTYEEAQALFNKYRPYVWALVSDVRFNCANRSDPQAGFKLAEYCTKAKPELAVLLQSTDPSNGPKAQALGWHFAEKRPEVLRPALHNFLEESLGFGDFVFRLPDRREVARAKDTFEFEKLLKVVDIRSIYYHAANCNFSVWLRARHYFALAEAIEKVRVEDYAHPEELRGALLAIIERNSQAEYQGKVADFSLRSSGQTQHNFFRIGGGSIGGKGRSIAFLNSRLAREDFLPSHPGLEVAIPKTVILGVDVYDRFMELNHFQRRTHFQMEDEAYLRQLYTHAQLPREILPELRAAAQLLQGPIAVRSSSLLEDSQNQSCAGIYATYVVPEMDSRSERRFELLCQAIKLVYMSAVSTKARLYFSHNRSLGEEEKMAVILQEVVGRQHGAYFYPHIAGVAMSINYYPLGPQKTTDGMVAIALGLGRTVAGGGRCLRFSPKWPQILPHLYFQERYLDSSQRQFYALTLGQSTPQNPSALVQLDLEEAERAGVLEHLASVWSPESGSWRDSLQYPGPRALTFNNLLRWGEIPLAATLNQLLERCQTAVGCPVELEFAIDWIPPGSADPAHPPTLYLLQIRPMSGVANGEMVHACGYPPEEIAISGDSLGHGIYEEVCDILYVADENLVGRQTRALAARIAKLNQQLMREGRPYLLIGPGRWGSQDPHLGIPVQTGHILGARLIVELPYGERFVEPSLGSHFFHELAAMRIGYLTLGSTPTLEDFEARSGPCIEDHQTTCAQRLSPDLIDRQWLESLPALSQEEGLYHLRLAQPLLIHLNGHCGRGVVLKPRNAAGNI